ncbi:MAG TPA: SBBP repeat-containing protein [Polyangiaceae bacterium]|nr:SBBP repeat-containing protein [Polyangiaceae bacterium]
MTVCALGCGTTRDFKPHDETGGAAGAGDENGGGRGGNTGGRNGGSGGPSSGGQGGTSTGNSGGTGQGGTDQGGTGQGATGHGATGQGGTSQGGTGEGATGQGGTKASGGTGAEAEGGAGAGGEGGVTAGAGGEGGAAPPPEPCTDEGVIECTGNAVRTRRLCSGGFWTKYDDCDADQRCDTRAGNNAQCLPVVAQCVGKNPGQLSCNGLVIGDCGPDLVTVENQQTPCDSFCVEHDGTAECSACPSGQYSSDGTPAGCKAWTNCTAGQYASTLPTATSDRACSACGSGSFTTTATANQASCTPWTACTAGQYVTVNGTSTSDRSCLACAGGSFSAGSNATSCSPWSNCSSGNYVSTAGSATSDRACTPCASGSYSASANATSCATWSSCPSGDYVSTAGSATSDRACAACASGTFTTSANQTSCATWSSCASGKYVSTAGSATSDRVCTACASGTFSNSTNQTSCSTWTSCASGKYVSTAGSATSDRACTACASGTFTSSANQTSCSTWTSCVAGQFVSGAGSATADRTCAGCGSGTFSTSSNSSSCTGWASCSAGQFVSTAGTATNDRACTACGSGTFSANSNQTSCGAWTTCNAGSYVSTAGTKTSDRVCGACGSGTYTSSSNLTSCSPWDICTWAQSGTVQAGTSTSDAVCGAANSAYRSYGTDAIYEFFYALGRDSNGNVYAGGETNGDTFGTNLGGVDATLVKIDANGNTAWTQQFGTDGNDDVFGIATDASGNVYVSGSTAGSLGAASQGDDDIYVRKYSTAGAIIWTKQFGSSGNDGGTGIAVDGAGNVVVTGETYGSVVNSSGGEDVVVRKYDSNGNSLWTDQFGTANDEQGRSVGFDSANNVYVVGYTTGSLGGTNAGSNDIFVRKYNANGVVQWTKQFGTSSDDWAERVAVDANGNTYVGGETVGALASTNAGGWDGFILKLNSSGVLQWSRQFGTSAFEEVEGLALAPDGSIYAAGDTGGVMQAPGAGGNDDYVVRYLSDGTASWTRQFGSSGDELEYGLAVDSNGYAYLAGYTTGDLQFPNQGPYDDYVVQLVP